jgi:hypothetical protein
MKSKVKIVDEGLVYLANGSNMYLRKVSKYPDFIFKKTVIFTVDGMRTQNLTEKRLGTNKLS